MKLTAFATLSLTACLAVAYAGAPEGKSVYVAKCQGCHGANGEGKPAIAKMFNVTLPVLGSKDIQAKSDADLKKTIVEGHGKMKPVGGLDDKQVSDVIAFVRTLKD
ncbi:MAG TPA: cytochrome c [Bryobacteraceae bacterium]|nr:cytochrome c [Bryobacteraceae bacterium]